MFPFKGRKGVAELGAEGPLLDRGDAGADPIRALQSLGDRRMPCAPSNEPEELKKHLARANMKNARENLGKINVASVAAHSSQSCRKALSSASWRII